MSIGSAFRTIIDDIKGLWEKEKPTIEAVLKTVVDDVEPIWKTALGSIIMDTVTNLQSVAASQGGAAARAQAVQNIGVAIKAAGQTASASTVNTLIELAVQKLQVAGAALAATPAPDAADSTPSTQPAS